MLKFINVSNKINLSKAKLLLLLTISASGICSTNLLAESIDLNLKQDAPSSKSSATQSKDSNLKDFFDDDSMSEYFKDFQKLHKEMNQLFEKTFSQLNLSEELNNFHKSFDNLTLTPGLKVDMKNETDKYVLTVHLPEKQNNNLKATLDGQKLTIAGETQEQMEETKANSKQIKKYSSAFVKSIMLNEKVKKNSLTTKTDKNNLIITVLKDK